MTLDGLIKNAEINGERERERERNNKSRLHETVQHVKCIIAQTSCMYTVRELLFLFFTRHDALGREKIYGPKLRYLNTSQEYMFTSQDFISNVKAKILTPF